MKSNPARVSGSGELAGKRVTLRNPLILAVVAMILLSSTALVNAQGVTYTVNSTGDDVLGTNNCTDRNGTCTLRAAIQAAHGHAGADEIDFSLPAGSVINLTQVLPEISESLEIIGPGPDKLTVRRDTGGDYSVFKASASGTVTFFGLTISNGNRSGGGIFKYGSGTVNVTNCTVSGNSATNGGGGLYTDGTLNITNSMIVGNSTSSFGGGIFKTIGTLTITNSTISGNTALNAGGGILVVQALVVITNSTISGNSANKEGGGIASGYLTTTHISNSTISGNRAPDGGGIYIAPDSTATITNSTISGHDSLRGGGIFNDGGVSVTNSTISGNEAGSGGAIHNTSEGNVTNSTISGNNCLDEGGGILNRDTGTMNVKSSIIALNTNANFSLGEDILGSFISQGFNLIGKNNGAETSFPAGNPNANNDRVGTSASPFDPKLDPNGLQNNGGPTPTIALLPGSPAIDKGTSRGLTGLLTEDQRGTDFPRTVDDPTKPNGNGGDGTDIGAFEVQTTAPSVLANISTRLRVETGDNVLIGGFIVTGTQPKKIIVRGIGPSLAQFFADPLADPVLELYQGNTLIATNGNWKRSQAEVEATGLAPSNELESAIVQVIPPGNYTAIVRGVDNGTGIGVVEAYDLDLTVDSQLANISTRGLVQTGDNVLIAGTIVVGSPSRKVIVRAIGPSLPLAGKLADPTLELRDSNGNILQANDNWQESPNKQAIIDSGVPPTHDLESAIVATLPGNGASYTAIVRGVNATTGIAVVEVYALN